MEKIALFLTKTKKLSDDKIRKILRTIPEKRQEEFFKEKKLGDVDYFDLSRDDSDEFMNTLHHKLPTLKGKQFWSFLMDLKGSVRVWAV